MCLHEQLIFMGKYLLYMDPMGEQRDVEKDGKFGDTDIARTIHGTGIFTYVKTIKINYSCRYICQSHGWYGSWMV